MKKYKTIIHSGFNDHNCTRHEPVLTGWTTSAPRHAIPQSALTDDDLEKLLNGVYATMENYTFTFWWLDDIQGENFKAGPGGGQITDPCEMSPSYTNQAINILSFWRNSFTTLHQVNFLVETYEAFRK